MFKTQAIIIHRREVGEADRLFDVLTEKFGRLALVARGSRKPASKLNPHLQLFDESEIIFVDGKKNKVLTSALQLKKFENLHRDALRFRAASYGARLIRHFAMSASGNDGDFFALFKNFLSALDQGDAGRASLICRYFEYGFLDALGFKPHFENCLSCGGGGAWQVDLESGGRLCNNCAIGSGALCKISSATAEFLEDLIGQKNTQKIPSSEILTEAAAVFRNFFHYHAQKSAITN